MSTPRWLKRLNTVFHVGTLNPADQGRHGARGGHSHEGQHLSISLHPEAWRRVARLGDLPTHTLFRSSGAFVDLYALQASRDWDAVVTWGLNEGLVTRTARWNVMTLDEDDDWCSQSLPTLEEALSELAESQEDDLYASFDSDFEAEAGVHAAEMAAADLVTRWPDLNPADQNQALTDFLGRYPHQPDSGPLIRATSALSGTPRLALLSTLPLHGDDQGVLGTLWSQQQGESHCKQIIDGVWWDQELDVANLSAPRGLIFKERVPEWTAEVAVDAR